MDGRVDLFIRLKSSQSYESRGRFPLETVRSPQTPSAHPHASITDPATVTETTHTRSKSNSGSSCDTLNTDRRVTDQPVSNIKMSSVDFSFCLSRLTVEQDPLAGRRSGLGGVGGARRTSTGFSPKLWPNLLSPLGTEKSEQIPPRRHSSIVQATFATRRGELMCATELLNLLGGARTEGESARCSSHSAATAGPPPVCRPLFARCSPATANKI